jgi:hypothetical protein
LRDRLPRLLKLGVLERIARGKVVLHRRIYPYAGKRDVVARKRDAARERNKLELLNYIDKNSAAGATMESLINLVPSLSRSSIKRLLDELRRIGRVHSIGTKRNVRWFPGPAPGFGSTNSAKGSK